MIVICQDCKKKVSVNLIMFGGGYIALCPICSGIAANLSKEELEQKELEQKELEQKELEQKELKEKK